MGFSPFGMPRGKMPPKKSARVAEHILASIKAGEYGKDDKLPSERKIAEALNVSRIPVREALSALQLAGVVESVPGDGTYVRRAEHLPSMRSMTLLVLEKGESPFMALRARKPLELGIVDLLVDRSEEIDLDEISSVLESMALAVESADLPAYFRANQAFHLGLAKATGNSILEDFMEYLLGIMDQPLWLEAVQKHFTAISHVKEYAARHKRIFEAILARDRDAALQEVRDHFDRTAEEVKAYL